VATGEIEDWEPTPEEQGQDPAAVSLGRRGGLKGGKARAESLEPSLTVPFYHGESLQLFVDHRASAWSFKGAQRVVETYPCYILGNLYRRSCAGIASDTRSDRRISR
jgi:hypothetical protein